MLTSEEVVIEADGITLAGTVTVPEGTERLVVFAHGSGSSRFSRRNRYVADQMNAAGLGTLLFDLLTPGEDEVDAVTRQFRFDIPLLATRLVSAIHWTRRQPTLAGLSMGLFGASTGAAAALIAAAERPQDVQAVVSRGGRPDLAGMALPRVMCPTFLLVGGDDTPVIELNETARDAMTAPVQLHIIRGATHLFEEAGKLDEVAGAAREWFLRHLTGGAARETGT